MFIGTFTLFFFKNANTWVCGLIRFSTSLSLQFLHTLPFLTTDPVFVQSVLLLGPGQQSEVDQPDQDHTRHHHRVREEGQKQRRISKRVHKVGCHQETTGERRQMCTLTMHGGRGCLTTNL